MVLDMFTVFAVVQIRDLDDDIDILTPMYMPCAAGCYLAMVLVVS